ncbi:4-hydroxy-tetrahydrodipicolinate synthase [Companilactobacillus halodurans]|uniref:4-hydroxy-tetrahydrodipicolinate synthase n=1 Tax=Companilactobacillus halodurans TaxID=2584183 RepID=A0A5P0ZX13_9LACO|nr:4-hydroxy-tetrahydrodipicolinate synthase [Companilactobacillus halodurans]MQS97579.1 4-hydroxy-tetrahydrodipicolinate synthase [Companilactobacillus halodurans]
MADVSGIIVAMVTPLDDEQKISYSKTDKLLNKLLSYDINGIFILGTNGEAYSFTEDEKYGFAKHVIDYVGNKTQIFVGTGLNSTSETISFSQKISQLHPDALSVVTPYFVPNTQDELINNFNDLANSVDVPIILYNMPGKTGVNIDPKTVAELSKNPNIVGVKDSSGDIENMRGYLKLRNNNNFGVLSGSDSKILELLEAGGDGAIAATANLLTQNDVNIYKYFKDGNIEKAKKNQQNIEPLRKILHTGTTPSSLKASVTLSGIDVGSAKKPVIMPDKEELKEINKMIEYYRTNKIIEG